MKFPRQVDIGSFVCVSFNDETGKTYVEFGTIIENIDNDYLVVQLETMGGFASVPFENVCEASRC